jgi:hypothetical protein
MALGESIADMGIWRSTFGWQGLFRWDVLGVIVPGLFIACGLAMLGIDWFPHNLLISQVCFAIAALLLLIKFIGNAVQTRDGLASRILFVSLLCPATLVMATIPIWKIQAHKSPTPTFTLDLGPVIKHSGGGTSSLFMVYPTLRLMRPVDILTTIRLTNVAAYPILIAKCSASLHIGERARTMKRMSPVGSVFMFDSGDGDPKNERTFEISTPFIEAISDKQIEARRRAEVLIVFEYPDDVSDDEIHNGKIVISVTDESGYTANVTIESLPVDRSDGLGGLLIHRRNSLDVSSYSIQRQPW